MPIKSNLREVQQAIFNIGSCLNMRGKGRMKTIGEDAVDIITQGIHDRAVIGQKKPDGSPFDDLAPSTVAEKRRKGYPDTIGVRTGQMLSESELAGEKNITRGEVAIEYGQSEATRERMERFSEGRRGNGGKGRQPPRPVFELDDGIIQDLDDLVEDVVDNAIRENGG